MFPTVRKFSWIVGVAALLCATACSSKKPIVVGSKDGVEQHLLSEITAQFLEQKTEREIKRRFDLGETRTTYQALLDAEISLYPEYSGLIVSDILKEQPSTDPSIVWERARIEVRRIALVEFLEPFGFSSTATLVVGAAGNEGITSGSDAKASTTRWRIGLPEAFQHRADSGPEMNRYSFDMGAPFRILKETALFPALEKGDVNMVVTALSDGHLAGTQWKALTDDLQAFPPSQAALLVRDDVVSEDPELRKLLQMLSGKITLEQMRMMNAAVVVDERKVEEVAAEFLKSAGLGN